MVGPVLIFKCTPMERNVVLSHVRKMSSRWTVKSVNDVTIPPLPLIFSALIYGVHCPSRRHFPYIGAYRD